MVCGLPLRGGMGEGSIPLVAMTDYIICAVCVLIVLRHALFVWPADDRPLAKLYYLDDYRHG
jgi:hypothetical protein